MCPEVRPAAESSPVRVTFGVKKPVPFTSASQLVVTAYKGGKADLTGGHGAASGALLCVSLPAWTTKASTM